MSDIQYHHPVIELAWKRQAELSKNSTGKRDEYYAMRKWISILGVAAVLFAVLYDNYFDVAPEWASWILRILLIAAPIVSSAIAAFGKQFQQGKQYLALRGAAEEIKKEIYLYRTILKNEPNRHKILNDHLAKIQRTMFQSINGELVLKPYNGPIPQYYDPNDPDSDPGITDLTGDEYFTFRVKDQLDWHTGRINERHAQRRQIQILILLFGGLGAFLAALGNGFAVWVALTAAITSAFVGWEEIRGLDETIANYSRVVLELNIISDRWLTLQNDEKTDEEFFKMVKDTEEVMRAQHSKWMKSMQENFAEAEGEEAQLVESLIQKARESDQELQAKISEEAQGVVEDAHDQVSERVALGVKDAAAHVSAQISSISDEVPDGFEADQTLGEEPVTSSEEMESVADTAISEIYDPGSDALVDVPADEFIDEVFDDQETDVFDTAIEDDDDLFGTSTEGEVFEDVPEDEFVDEVFDDGEGEEGVG